MADIKEFHLFAGIGGGIYGGAILGHRCCGGVEIDDFCKKVLRQRQADGWLDRFELYDDVTTLDGRQFRGQFDVVCGGFPCQAFSTAAHGKNIAEKNLWDYMLKFIVDSEAPVVFGENVVLRAITKARADLEAAGYRVVNCRLSCKDLGADHQRNRFWLLAVKDEATFARLAEHDSALPKITARCWTVSPHDIEYPAAECERRRQLKGIGNAQSPLAAATAFRVLVERYKRGDSTSVVVSPEELSRVFTTHRTWIRATYGDIGGLHTPTTMANYACASMMKHQSCVNFVNIFGRPQPLNGEYLMGFPIGATSPFPLPKSSLCAWKKMIF